MIEFDDQYSIGNLSDADLADYLVEIGDEEAAEALRRAGVRGQGLGLLGAAYRHTAHVFGFIEEGAAGQARFSIRPAGAVEPDESLIGRRVKVTLDGFRVAQYPGLGRHTVLFDFQGRDQAGGEAQDLQFATVLSVNDGDNAAVSGVPIFTGLTVPADGLAFKARTIVIKSSGDETIIDVLQSSTFREGLKLLGKVQPVLPQMVSLAGGITTNLMKRRRNKQVQCFDLGLDFSQIRTSARLRCGSYIVVQVPDPNLWKWENWTYDPSALNIVNGAGVIAPHNTIIFSVSDSSADQATSAIRDEARALHSTLSVA